MNTAYAQSMSQAVASQPSPILSFIPMILIFVIFYFLLIRPQQQQQKEQKQMLQRLQKNDEVITSGGLHGTIVGVKEKTFLLRISDEVKVEIEKNAVTQKK